MIYVRNGFLVILASLLLVFGVGCFLWGGLSLSSGEFLSAESFRQIQGGCFSAGGICGLIASIVVMVVTWTERNPPQNGF